VANRSVNKVTLLGHLGRDAETRFTASGTGVVSFSVGTSRGHKDQSGEWKEETTWTNVVLWKGDKLAPYLTKGKQVYVEGRIQTRNYEKEGRKIYVTEVIADDVILLGGRGGGDMNMHLGALQTPATDEITDDDSELPF